MSDDLDLDKLKSALKSAEPTPDHKRRAYGIVSALQEFDRIQETADDVRQMSDSPKEGAGIWTGVSTMFNRLTSRAALAGTASIAAMGVAALIVVPKLKDPQTDPETYVSVDPQHISETSVSEPSNETQPVDIASDAESSDAPTDADVRPRPRPNVEDRVAVNEMPEGDEPNVDAGSYEPLAPAITEPVPEVPPEQVVSSEEPEQTPPPTSEPVATMEEPAETEPELEGDTAEVVTEADTETVPLTEEATPMPEVAEAPVPDEQAGIGSNIELSGSAEMGATSDEQESVFLEDVDVEFSIESRSESDGANSDNFLAGAAFDGDIIQERGRVSADIIARPEPNTEAFPEAERNPLKITAEEPVSTFSIDVDTSSYGVVRSSINAGYLPNSDAVRVEEMINYFPYDWPAPQEGEAPFRPTVSVMGTPWNAGTQLVTIALQGRMPALEDRPPLNLVFLIDTSGSMNNQNKLPLLKQSFRLMLSQLRPEDQVAIVTYAGSAGMVLEPTPAAERDKISAALGQLDAGGSTAGQAGLEQAYDVAREMSEEGDVTRILLATDGDFNVGISDPEALEEYIAKERESGTYLSVLGFGRGNLDDATMQALAQNGNGIAAYIDTLNEAQKVLVDQLSGALFPIADDVKIQVEWNPATVAEYRLIGYETRALAREDFNNDKVDAGEIGAGHSVTAIYEITPVDSDARRTDPLRYGEVTVSDAEDELGFLRLRYKEPGEETSKLIERPIFTDTAEGGNEAKFAAAIAGFGQLLTNADYLEDWGWDEAITLAHSFKGEDTYGYRTEAVNLMRLGQSLSDQ